MPFKTPEKRRAAARAWHHRNKKWRNPLMQDYRRKVREQVINMLGGECSYCGCDVFSALEINHKNGKGTVESSKRKGGHGSISLVMDIYMGRRGVEDLEIACIVCNAWHNAVMLKGLPNNWKISWNPPR